MMKKILLISFFLVKITALSLADSNTHASPHKTFSPIYPIDKLVDNDFLVECRFTSPYVMSFYAGSDKSYAKDGVLSYPNNRGRQANNPYYDYDVFRFSGVKALKRFTRSSDGLYEEITSLDVDVYAHGMHILRIASYGANDIEEGIEHAGYYYIVKGSPQQVLPILNRLKEDISDINAEATQGGNTRVRCMF